MTTGEVDRQKGLAVYFFRASEVSPVTPQAIESELTFGIIGPSALEHLQVALSELYLPLLQLASCDWEQGISCEEGTSEFFFLHYNKFCETLGEAVNTLQGGFTLRRPERMFDIENKAAAFNRAGAEPEIVTQFEAVVEDWCRGIEKLLAETDSSRLDTDDAGPETEAPFAYVSAALPPVAFQLTQTAYRDVIVGLLA